MQHTFYSLHRNAHPQTCSATPTFPKVQLEHEPSDTQPLAAFTFAVLFVGLFLTLSRKFTNFPLCLAEAGSVEELKGARVLGAHCGCRSSCFGCTWGFGCISILGLLIKSERLSVPISPPRAVIKVATLSPFSKKKYPNKKQTKPTHQKKKITPNEKKKKPDKHPTKNTQPNCGGKRNKNISSWRS